MDIYRHALRRIERCEATIGVIGLGYVGVPLALQLAQAGFAVLGFDIDEHRVNALNAGRSHLEDVEEANLQEQLRSGRFRASTNFEPLSNADVVIICVPTPLRKTREPDISPLLAAARQVTSALRPGQLIVLESTTYPGTTDDLLRPMFERSGLTVGEDIFLAFSSERVDPGNPRYGIRNTPKVVGAVTSRCLGLATALLSSIVDTVVPVSSPAAAELSKLLENMFRAVNIALANELAQMAAVLGVDVWEVIDAASTKPFGFMPFYPGPGLGGHCIPVDPHYLSWKLRSLNYRARFVELASEVNGEMPHFVLNMVTNALNEHKKCLNGAKILILGVAYKANVGDVRESPGLDVLTLLLKQHALVTYADTHVPVIQVGHNNLQSVALSDEVLSSTDCVVIVTAHDSVDYERVVRLAPLVMDTRNVTAMLGPQPHVWRLGRPTRSPRTHLQFSTKVHSAVPLVDDWEIETENVWHDERAESHSGR